jgi:hypothetical protein
MAVIWLKGDDRVSPQGPPRQHRAQYSHLLPTFGGLGRPRRRPLWWPGTRAAAAVSGFVRAEAPKQPRTDVRPAWAYSSVANVGVFSGSDGFAKSTVVYRTRSRIVAILPDWTLVADDGAGGAVFDTASDCRDKMRDEGEWILVKDFQ